jgi:N-methylhydantoinase A
MYQLGIDTGGTFTDFVLIDDATGEMETFKTLSTTDDPSRAVIRGLDIAQNKYGVLPSHIKRITYGTTVATNALLERKGSNIGLLCTKGFRDVLEIRRQWRPKLFDLYYTKPEPLVRRHLRLEVAERVDAGGKVLQKIDLQEVRTHVKQMIEEGVEAVAVCFLFSFLNPSHEKSVEELMQREFTEVYITLSSGICPEFREYERTATTVLNAYLMPITSKYLKRLRGRLREKGITRSLRVMQSNGGLMKSEDIEKAPVNSLLSGPVGGVVGSVKLATALGFKNLITLDMGGTSTDISLIQNSELELITEAEISYNPVKVPQVNINTIGAGGGSIARVFGGGLKVGPQSAGADPGPVCYGRGGKDSTTTDAALQTGYIDPDYFLGGEMDLDYEASRRILERDIAKPLGMSIEEAAYAILLIQSLNIEHGIRAVSLEKGHDPRDFILVSFGGASGLLVGLVARQLSIPKILIPRQGAVFSAVGLLMSDIRRTRSLTRIAAKQNIDLIEVNRIYDQLEEDVRQELISEGGQYEDMVLQRSVDMRYVGQAYEVHIPCPNHTGSITAGAVEDLVHLFHDDHRSRFGHSAEDEPVEFVCFRVVGVLPVQELTFPAKRELPQPELRGERKVYFGAEYGHIGCPIYEREKMKKEYQVVGPAIIEGLDTTIVVYPDQKAESDTMGNVVLSAKNKP